MAARVSDVVFNPRVDGIVRAFEVQSVTGTASGRRVIVSADIRRPDGTTGTGRLVVSLRMQDGRWRIAAIQRLASP